MVKLPPPPPAAALTLEPDDLCAVAEHTVLWRLHRTAGAHVVPWNQLRYAGPTSARFDPHIDGERRGVSYAALDVPTALAEVFQDRRVINLTRDAPYLTAWRPRRSLRLLDLSGTWPVRNGASHAINTGRHDYCRAWAQSVHTRWPDLDGLWHTSAMTGAPAVTLWTAAALAFPAAPDFSRPLADPGLRGWISVAAAGIGYDVV